jgi:prevent-host-death family protein
MDIVTVRDLRNHGGDVVTRVQQGETLIITRDGAEVAELRPLRRHPLPMAELIARRRHLPAVDIVAMRQDIDQVLDPTL